MKRRVVVELTEAEARELAHAAGQMADDYKSQLEGGPETDVSNRGAQACLSALQKLNAARHSVKAVRNQSGRC